VLVEEDRPGWVELTARELDVLVDGNNCNGGPDQPVVEFENAQDDSGFCIEGRKVDANGGYGIAGWEMSLDPLDKGGLDLDNTFTDGLGHFEFDFPGDDYRIPGAEYKVCEIGQDGWLAHNPTCQTVRLPEWPGACVQLADFVNQQVGHSESEYHPYPEGGKGSEYPSQQPSGEYPSQQPSGEYPSQQPSGEYPSQQPSGPQGGYPSQQPSGPEYGSQGGQQCSSYHTVQAGEGLYDIGRQYQKSPQQMIEANPSVSGDDMVIYVGQNICIP
jgi:LysM repeat protein